MHARTDLTVLTALATVLAVESASADSGAIYNDICREEVAAFQQASNADDVTTTRHDLLLCLADDAYAESNQSDSDFAQWTDTRHFQVFATETDVKIGDTVYVGLFPQAGRQTSRSMGGAALLLGGTDQCTCPARAVTRAPGDPTDPLKSEGWDVTFTMNVGSLMAGGPEAFTELKGLLDDIEATGAVPFAPDQQAANVVAQFGALDGLQDSYTPRFNGRNPTTHYDWNFQSTTDTALARLAQAAADLSSTCGCPQYRIPLDRTGGDRVPSAWRQAEDFYFSTNDPAALAETFSRSGQTLGRVQGQGGQ